MRTIALSDRTYSRISMIKSYLSSGKMKAVTFDELLDRMIRASFPLAQFNTILGDMLTSLAGQLSEKKEILGIVIFGSVAKQLSNSNSDIDLFILVKKKTPEIFEYIETSLRNSESIFSKSLSDNIQPIYVSPAIFGLRELDFFRPIFLDIVDYGMVLYERPPHLTNFLKKYESLPHRREYSESGEMVSWQA